MPGHELQAGSCNHGLELCSMNDCIVNSLNTSLHSSASLSGHRGKVHNNIKPGWNDHVGEQHTAAREAFKLWSESGRPRQGPLFKNKKLQNAKRKGKYKES